MESPILINSNLPTNSIVAHGNIKKSNNNDTNNNNNTNLTNKNRPPTTKAILRRPTIASSIDVINLTTSPAQITNSPETTFITTKSKLNQNEHIYNSLTSSNGIFQANDSFYLHTQHNSNHRTYTIVSEEAADTNVNNNENNIDFGNLTLVNHTKSMFDNIKQEQQKVLEQAKLINGNLVNKIDKQNVKTSKVETMPILESMPTSLSISDKPKKRVSFNENLLEVHLIPTNSSNQIEECNSWDQNEQTTLTTITTPNIINAKRLISSSKFYRTPRPLMQKAYEATAPTTLSDAQMPNEFKRFNPNSNIGFSVSSVSTTPRTIKSSSLNTLNRSHSISNSQSNSISINDINETLNDKNLFKLSIKTIKFNNGINSINGGGITIQPITENSIKSVMTIEPVNIKPKGFLYEQQQSNNQNVKQSSHPQQQQGYFNEYTPNLYTKYINTSTLPNDNQQQKNTNHQNQQQQQNNQNKNTNVSTIVVNHYSEKEISDKENIKSGVKRVKSVYTKDTEQSKQQNAEQQNTNEKTQFLINQKNIKTPFILNESIPLYTNNLLTNPSGQNFNFQGPIISSSSSLISTQSSLFFNENQHKKLINKSDENKTTTNNNLNTNVSQNKNSTINQQLIILRNANIINTSPSSTNSVTIKKNDNINNSNNNNTPVGINVHRHINFKIRNQTNNNTTNTNITPTNTISSSELRRTHSALPILLRNNNNVNNKIHAYNNIIAQSKTTNSNKTTTQIPAATVVTTTQSPILLQPQLSTLKRSGTLKANINENF